MKRFFFLLPALLFLFLPPFSPPSAAFRHYPVGGVWDFSGSVSVSIGGSQAVLHDSGRITIDSGYSYDHWYGDYDERIRTFYSRGTFSVSVSPEIREEYSHFKRVEEWYDFRSLELYIDGTRYIITLTDRNRADVRITRTIVGQHITAVFPAVRIRWDEDWDEDLDDGWYYGIGAGCDTGGGLSGAAFLFLLPFAFALRRK